MKRVVQWLVLSLSLFCLATPFCLSETIPGQPNKGEIDFEVFRQISTGMTKEEVLNLAGQPAERYDPRECEVAGDLPPFVTPGSRKLPPVMLGACVSDF